MSPDDSHRTALRVVITDAIGRPLPKRSLARWLEAVAPVRARGDVTVALVSDTDIRRLNRSFAHVNHATDVLSFPSKDSQRVPQHLGDVVIATGVASRQAWRAGHSVDTELRILSLHGLLHLLGYDHTSDGGRMASLERRLRRKGGLRAGLIERAGGTGSPGVGATRRVAPTKRRRRAR